MAVKIIIEVEDEIGDTRVAEALAALIKALAVRRRIVEEIQET